MRRALVLATVLVLAGCAGPFSGPLLEEGSTADPSRDTVGWEDGYWHNESVAVTTDDGLDDAELEAVVARAKARVEHIRQVEFSGSVSVRTVDRSEVGGGGGSTPAPALRAFDNAKMEALLLVGEDEDSMAVQQRNREVSLGGYYAPGRDEIVVVTDGEGAVVDETTLAHELMHAWQDRRFGLGSFTAGTRDGHNANDGIVEGDANYVEYRYDSRCGESWDCVAPADDDGGGGGGLANEGVFVMKYFPYSDGPSFVAACKKAGGWDAVNEVYRNPPASSEQVAHPEKYGSDEPTAVAVGDHTTDEWERVRPPDRPDHGEVGQAGITAMLVYPMYHSEGNTTVVPPSAWFNRTGEDLSRLDPFDYGHTYAAGWDGDRMHVYRNGDGETGYVWRIVWDSPRDAREFYGAYRQVLRYWGAERVDDHTYRIDDGPFADAIHVTVDGSMVTIVNAPTVDDLSSVRTTLGEGGDTPVTVTQSPDPVESVTPGLGVSAALLALLLVGGRLARR
jgi:hypothetical protein